VDEDQDQEEEAVSFGASYGGAAGYGADAYQDTGGDGAEVSAEQHAHLWRVGVRGGMWGAYMHVC